VVVVDGASPAASIVARLKAQKCKTIVTTAPEMARAYGGFLDDVVAGRLTHHDEPPLNDAVAGARRRPIGEAGAFGWDRRDGSVFVAPLVAVTLARFGAVTARRTGERHVRVMGTAAIGAWPCRYGGVRETAPARPHGRLQARIL